jgi:hypothetical protein
MIQVLRRGSASHGISGQLRNAGVSSHRSNPKILCKGSVFLCIGNTLDVVIGLHKPCLGDRRDRADSWTLNRGNGSPCFFARDLVNARASIS